MLAPAENSAMARSMRATVCGEKKFCARANSSLNFSGLKVSDLCKNLSNLATRRRQGNLKNSTIVRLQKEASRLQAASWKSCKTVYLAKISVADPRQPKALKCKEAREKIWVFDKGDGG